VPLAALGPVRHCGALAGEAQHRRARCARARGGRMGGRGDAAHVAQAQVGDVE
jgi:hypothetical protein